MRASVTLPQIAVVLAQWAAGMGMPQPGIRLFGVGDMTDDDTLNDVALGVVTAQFHSAAYASAVSRAFVEGYRRISGGRRPNTMGVGGYDAMAMAYHTVLLRT